MDGRRELGALGEAAALRRYLDLGYHPLARNWRCRAGELDLVLAGPDGLVVICEVKTRRGSAFGGGHDAVTFAKRRKLRQLAALFLSEREAAAPSVRFDVASVLLDRAGRADVEIFQDAFQ